VLTFYERLDCDATSAVLGAAGALTIWKDFPNAPRANTWYPSALANKLAHTDILPEPQPDGSEADIIAFFNSALGADDCLAGSAFYLGLDGQAPAGQIDLLTTVCTKWVTASVSKPSPTTPPANRSRTRPRCGTTCCSTRSATRLGTR